MPQYAKNQTLKSPSGHIIVAKRQATIGINAVNSEKRKTKAQVTKLVLANYNSGQANSNSNNNNNAESFKKNDTK